MIYLLAEPQQEILKKVFSGKFKKPEISYLFEHTEMTSLKETGPVLVADPTVDTTILKQILEKNSGLLITSHLPQENILAQLRHILFVYFKPDQVGIFRYYDPYIASYFFASLNEQETAQWLGPIEQIQWFNTDWRNKVNQPDQWQQKNNIHARNWQLDAQRLKTKPILTENQLLALQDMQQEKFAYQWQQNPRLNLTDTPIDPVIYWVKQGLRDNFTKTNQLNQYLSIRANYPKQLPPANWPTDNIEERLIYLEYYLAKAVV